MHDKKSRRQIRLIAEAIDDEPKMFGIRVVPGKHPIDQLIMYAQQNLVKWDWNNNKFIKAMRDAYHNAGMTVPSGKEQLVQDLQKQSVQNPKLLNQLISALGGMSRRTFMGLSASAGAGVAAGMNPFAEPEKSKAADWDGTLQPNQHYAVTYRNWQNQTRVWRDLIYTASNGHMYWFMDPKKPRGERKRKYAGRELRTRAEAIRDSQRSLARWKGMLAGTIPWRQAGRNWMGKAHPAKFVKSNWPKTIERIKRAINYHTEMIAGLQQAQTHEAQYMEKQPYRCITLQVENVVEIRPLGGK